MYPHRLSSLSQTSHRRQVLPRCYLRPGQQRILQSRCCIPWIRSPSGNSFEVEDRMKTTDCGHTHPTCNTDLGSAVCSGRTSVVHELLENRSLTVDINEQDSRGRTAVFLASENGYVDIVRKLLDKDESCIDSMTEDDRYPLSVASANGHESVVELLLDRGAPAEPKKRTFHPLGRASRYGHTRIAKLLLERGANVNTTNKQEWSPLMFASKFDHADIVELLIENGAGVNNKGINGWSPICLAASAGNNKMLKLLLDNGADIDSTYKDDWSSIHNAAHHGHIHTLKFLLTRKANMIESKNADERTPLNVAAVVGNREAIEFLIEHGADCKSKDINGHTAQDNCIIHGHVECVKYFTQRLPKKNTPEFNNALAWMLDLAAKNGKRHVVSYLIGVAQDIPQFLEMNLARVMKIAIANDHLMCVQDLHSYGRTKLFQRGAFTGCLSKLISANLHHYLLLMGLITLRGPNASRPDAPPNMLFGNEIDWGYIENRLRPSQAVIHQSSTAKELLGSPGLGSVHILSETLRHRLTNSVDDKVNEITKVVCMEHELKLKLIGSAAENAKVGLPDEFDYMLESDRLRDIKHTLVDVKHGYIRIDTEHAEHSSKRNHKNLFSCIVSNISRDDDMVHSRPSAVAGDGEASTSLKMVYPQKDSNGQRLAVSVDLVPVINVSGWPDEAIPKTWLLDKQKLTSRGYKLVGRPPNKDSAFGKTFSEKDRERLYRVTFSHLEVEHISQLKDSVRNAYVLSKCLRSPIACRAVVKDKDGVIHFVEKFITSYLLKTIFLHNVSDFIDSQKQLIEMVYIIYSQLVYCLSRKFIPTFWIPKVNLLVGRDINAVKSHKVAVFMKNVVKQMYEEETGMDTPCAVDDDMMHLLNDVVDHKIPSLPRECRSGVEIVHLPMPTA